MKTSNPLRLITEHMKKEDGHLRDDFDSYDPGFVVYWDGEKVLFSKEYPPKEYVVKISPDELRAILHELETGCNVSIV